MRARNSFGTHIASIKLLEKFDFKLWGRLVGVAEIDGEVSSQGIYGR